MKPIAKSVDQKQSRAMLSALVITGVALALLLMASAAKAETNHTKSKVTDCDIMCTPDCFLDCP